MSMGRLKIIRGQDKTAIIKLRDKNGDPVSLENHTQIYVKFLRSNRSELILSKSTIPAKKASAVIDDNTFAAVTSGANGNNIIISFDGITSIDDIITDWNTNNPTNLVELLSGDGSLVYPLENLQLSGGYNSYIPVLIISDILGKFSMTLTDYETNSLAVGENQSITITIDFGEPPEGTRLKAIMDGRLDVVNS